MGNVNRRTCKFTGIIRSTNDQFEPFFLDGKDVMSNGFCIVTNENGGTEEGPRVQYHLMMNANLIEEDADPRLMLSATADIDLSILQFSAASPERAAAWLASSFPDFMEELDARLMNTPSGDDDEAIMSLRGLRIPSEITEEDQFTRNCIAIYINRSVCTDQSVPYLVSMSGLASVYSPQGISTVYISNMNNRLFTAHAVHIERLIIDDDNSEYVLKLSGSFISDARDEEDVRMSIPITTFSKIKSIRNKYHS